MPNDVTLWKKSTYKWPLSSCDHNIQSSKSKMYLAAIIYKDKDLHSFLGNLHPCEYDTWFYNPPKINPFVPNAPFLYPLKTSKNHKVFWCFQGVEKGCIGSKWANDPTSSGPVKLIFEAHSYAANEQSVAAAGQPLKYFWPNTSRYMLTCCNMLLERASSHRFVNNSPRA